MIFNQTGSGGGSSGNPIIYDEMYGTTLYPTSIIYDFEGKDIPSNYFDIANGGYYAEHSRFKFVEKVLIKCNKINQYALYNEFKYMTIYQNISPKIKIKATEIADQAFNELDKNDSVYKFKIWLSKDITTISGSPFTDTNNLCAQFYCEAASQPSGWSSTWNTYQTYNTIPVTWGVTEAAFDAM